MVDIAIVIVIVIVEYYAEAKTGVEYEYEYEYNDCRMKCIQYVEEQSTGVSRRIGWF